jgi:hypothetical protein
VTWNDGQITKTWLRTTLLANSDTGLAAADVFYFGNAPGESGNSATNTFVDGSDFAGARDNFRNFLNRAPIYCPYDYNRDSFVDGSDMAIARDNWTNFLTALELLDLSPPGGAPALQSSGDGFLARAKGEFSEVFFSFVVTPEASEGTPRGRVDLASLPEDADKAAWLAPAVQRSAEMFESPGLDSDDWRLVPFETILDELADEIAGLGAP